LLAFNLTEPFIALRIGWLHLKETLAQNGFIAIVDDDEPLREGLGSVMKAAGFSIDTFGSAEEFLDSPHRCNAACLILDVRLPGMSGVELQRRLIDANIRVPIIFVTAHGDGSIRDLVMKAGAAAFLNKPVRSDRLLKEIYAALQKTGNGSHSDERN
jgi:FixJ family two-component response regulator